MGTILEIENLSKQYRLGYVGTGSISQDMNRFWHKIRGKEDPYLQIGEVNDRTIKATSKFVWALKDINFKVEQGEVLGVIGSNGAGKSTLLKILSRVTGPTTGTIKARGRIASLLEVGTGFHGELTGRENIFLNGAILGMTKKEIKLKLDDIIAFSGCERYIDTPVKRYSSGMFVRLAFAVAAFLEPEILIVDEVLAVGDMDFQEKAIGKMKDVSKNSGRTVLFVSHNMGAVEALCTKGMLMDKGTIASVGDTKSIIKQYITKNTRQESVSEVFANQEFRSGKGHVQVTNIQFFDLENNIIDSIPAGESFIIRMSFNNNFPEKEYTLVPSLSVSTAMGVPVSLHHSRITGKVYKSLPETGFFEFTVKNIALVPSTYYISYSLVNEGEILDSLPLQLPFSIIESNYYGFGEIIPSSHGIMLLNGEWKLM